MKRKRIEQLSSFDCTSLEYSIYVGLDKFDLTGFQKELGRLSAPFRRVIVSGKRFTAVAPTHDLSKTDYHVHYRGHWTKREFHVSLEYFPETEEVESTEKGPFSEDIIPWIARFFKNDKATARVNAEFVYTIKKCTLNLPLPMRLELGKSREIEITGMVANIPTKPEGVAEAFVTLSNDDVSVMLEASRLVNFQRFHLHDDLTALSTVARLFARKVTK